MKQEILTVMEQGHRKLQMYFYFSSMKKVKKKYVEEQIPHQHQSLSVYLT